VKLVLRVIVVIRPSRSHKFCASLHRMHHISRMEKLRCFNLNYRKEFHISDLRSYSYYKKYVASKYNGEYRKRQAHLLSTAKQMSFQGRHWYKLTYQPGIFLKLICQSS
jgi:hypothetical protein